MAESLSHKFGQLIGDLLELALEPGLQQFANTHGLYLDKKGPRAARPGKKVTWTDTNLNKHDLDFVIERRGTESHVGVPVAFIESAWRRYTKHSRNKAQEIQSAILPLAHKYKDFSPFLGVVLAGEFTKGALTQLKSVGFSVLYIPYETVLTAFSNFGLDVSFDEKTSEIEFKKRIDLLEKLTPKKTVDIANELLAINHKNVADFFTSLSNSVSRHIERIIILPLYGEETVSKSITEAINFLQKYQENSHSLPLCRYELIIKYNTGDKIEASFIDKKDIIQFLTDHI